jgi:branched-chain amino acid transport system permease protein/neutral amino acid transport system permease protein
MWTNIDAPVGIALIIRSTIQLVWGPDTHLYVTGIQLPHRVLGLRIRPNWITILVLAVPVLVAVGALLIRIMG